MPKIFSPLSYSVFLASAHTPPLQRGASAFVSLSLNYSIVYLSRTSSSIFPPTSSSIDPSLLGSNLFTLKFHSASFLQRTVWLVFHLFNRTSIHFLLFLCSYNSLFFALRHAVMHTNTSTFCMTSGCKELPCILLRSKFSSNLTSSSHCTSIWPSSSSSSSSFFAICEQSQFCFSLCPTVLCAVSLAPPYALDLSFTPATTA